jgi:hypothetical protein
MGDPGEEISEKFRTPSAENPESTRGTGNPGAVKPNNLLSFAGSLFTITRELLTYTQPFNKFMVAL